MLCRRSVKRYLMAPAIIRTPGLLMPVRMMKPVKNDFDQAVENIAADISAELGKYIFAFDNAMSDVVYDPEIRFIQFNIDVTPTLVKVWT